MRMYTYIYIFFFVSNIRDNKLIEVDCQPNALDVLTFSLAVSAKKI